MTENDVVPNACLIDTKNVTGKQVFKVIQKQTKIGRSPANDFVVLKGTVSVSHALLLYKNKNFYLEDLQSTNKTRLNGKVIRPNASVKLNDGDEILFDVFKFIFLVEKTPLSEEQNDPQPGDFLHHHTQSGKKNKNLKATKEAPRSAIKTIGKYDAVKLLGKGGFGSVWKAVDPKGNFFAVKILNPEVLENERAVRKFFHEAIILSQLKHPHITRFIDFFPEGGNYAIVMDFVEGTDLKSMIQERYGPLPFDHACKIAEQTLDAFQHAHEKQILHRDIKPENIIFDIEENVKVMDFGLAKMASTTTQNTAAYMISTHYTPPERFDRKREVTTQSDIYSLGLVFYEIFTGRRPFLAVKPSEIIFAHINTIPDPPETITNIPHEISQAILKALEKEPEDRFEDFDEFKEALLNGATAATKERKPSSSGQKQLSEARPDDGQPGRHGIETPFKGPIQFSAEHYNSGINILNFFTRALKKFEPQNPKASITQDGSKLKLIIDLPNGKQVTVEKDMKKRLDQNSPEQ